MRGRTVRLAAPLIVVAGLVAACGSSSGGGARNQSSLAPKAELSAALHSLSQGNALTATFRFHTTAANLIKIDRQQGDRGSDAIPPAIADAIASDHVTIEVLAPTGTTIAGLAKPAAQKNERTAITLGDDSQNYFSLLVVNRSIYAQIDLKYFLDTGGNSSAYAGLQHQVAALPAFARDFIAGKWVSLPYSTFQSFEGIAKGELGSKLPNQSKLGAIRDTLISTLYKDLSVSRVSSGSTDHLAISANVRTVLHDEFTQIRPLIQSIVGSFGGPHLPTPDFSQVPETNVHLDGYVSGGAFSKLSINFGQFQTTPPHFSLPFELDLSKSGAAITAPTTSTPIDFSALGQLFAAATTVTSSGGGSHRVVASATAVPAP